MPRNSYSQAVCDAPIAPVNACVSSFGIKFSIIFLSRTYIYFPASGETVVTGPRDRPFSSPVLALNCYRA